MLVSILVLWHLTKLALAGPGFALVRNTASSWTSLDLEDGLLSASVISERKERRRDVQLHNFVQGTESVFFLDLGPPSSRVDVQFQGKGPFSALESTRNKAVPTTYGHNKAFSLSAFETWNEPAQTTTTPNLQQPQAPDSQQVNNDDNNTLESNTQDYPASESDSDPLEHCPPLHSYPWPLDCADCGGSAPFHLIGFCRGDPEKDNEFAGCPCTDTKPAGNDLRSRLLKGCELGCNEADAGTGEGKEGGEKDPSLQEDASPVDSGEV